MISPQLSISTCIMLIQDFLEKRRPQAATHLRRGFGLPGGSLVELGLVGDLSPCQSQESILDLFLALIF